MKTIEKNKKGFTLVELVVAIVVIAILASILIPTFAVMIKKATMTVDMQIVRDMNNALATDENLNGKPKTVIDAKEVLIANGINNFDAYGIYNQYYWLPSENRVLIWDTNETTVLYPDEYKKIYKGLEEASSSWFLLSEDYGVTVVTPSEGESLRFALLEAVKAASDGDIIQLPKDSEVDLGAAGLYFLGAYMKKAGGTGKSITIDMNGGKIYSHSKYTNGYHYGLTIPAKGALTLMNGSLDIIMDHVADSSIVGESGSRIILNDVDMKVTNGAGIFPAGDASEVVIENSKINADTYPVGTNASHSKHISIIIKNSELIATSSTAVLINVKSDTYISNSHITGVVHAVVVRAGAITVENSSLTTTDTEPGIYSFDNFAYGFNFKGWWRDGNTIPAGTLVLGDYSKADGNGVYSYSGDVICELINSKLESAAPDKIPTILLAASDPNKNVSLTYDSLTSLDNIVVYGDIWNPTDDNVGVTFNHLGIIKVNGEEK